MNAGRERGHEADPSPDLNQPGSGALAATDRGGRDRRGASRRDGSGGLGARGGRGPPVLAFTPSRHDYGQVTAGQTAAQTFTLASTGGKASRALTVTLSESAAFTITAGTCTATSLGPARRARSRCGSPRPAPGTAAATLTAANNKEAVLATDSLTGTGASASHLYWTNFGAGTIMEASLDGTGAKAIASGQGRAVGVAVGPQ